MQAERHHARCQTRGWMLSTEFQLPILRQTRTATYQYLKVGFQHDITVQGHQKSSRRHQSKMGHSPATTASLPSAYLAFCIPKIRYEILQSSRLRYHGNRLEISRLQQMPLSQTLCACFHREGHLRTRPKSVKTLHTANHRNNPCIVFKDLWF